jgi:hypothetical protein
MNLGGEDRAGVKAYAKMVEKHALGIVGSAVEDLRSNIFRKRQTVEFQTWPDTIISLCDDFGNSNLFKLILERVEQNLPTVSLSVYLRNLRKVGIYRHGNHRIFNGFRCRGAALIRDITVEFVDCPDESTIGCCEDVGHFVNHEGKRLLGDPNFVLPEAILKKVEANYRQGPLAYLHAELRLAMEMRRRGYQPGLIGVSKGCCGEGL